MAKQLENVVVVACGRSAVARSGKKGALREMHPVDLGGLVLKGVLERDLPNLSLELIEDVILGCAQPDLKQGCNIARAIALRAGLPRGVPGVQINRFCSSGLQAVAMAVQMNEEGDLGVAVPDYTDENVSTKVVKIIQSYTGIVNKMVWRKL